MKTIAIEVKDGTPVVAMSKNGTLTIICPAGEVCSNVMEIRTLYGSYMYGSSVYGRK